MDRHPGEETREGSANRVAEKEKTEDRSSTRREAMTSVQCVEDPRWREGFGEERELQTATASEYALLEVQAVLWKKKRCGGRMRRC